MRGKPMLLVLVAFAIVVSGSAWADYVIYFKNGTTLPVRAYRVEDGNYHVDMGGNAFMAFPADVVEKVEDPNRSLNLEPSTIRAGSAATMFAGSRQGGSGGGRINEAAPRAAVQPSGRYNPGTLRDPNQENQPFVNGMVLPDGGAARANNVAGNGSLRGAQRVGNRYVMDSGQQGLRERAVNVQFADGRTLPDNLPNPGGQPANPPKK